PESGARRRLAKPPYDPAHERFNDGKCDPQGRFWAGTIYEPRDAARATLHCYTGGTLVAPADRDPVGTGLAWRPVGRPLYGTDPKAQTIYAVDVDPATGTLSGRRAFARFAPRADGEPLDRYGGRPDGAAVDVEGCYWVAMFEGQRLLRLTPEGDIAREV